MSRLQYIITTILYGLLLTIGDSASAMSAAVRIEPNTDGIIDKSVLVNIVVELTSHTAIDKDRVVVKWNGVDMTQILSTRAAIDSADAGTRG